MKHSAYLCLLLFTLVFSSCAGKQDADNLKSKGNMSTKQRVVFVCEHGSAKSTVAAAHFNKIAAEKNLNMSAISRGTNPDEEIPPKVINGLQSDGLGPGELKPRKLDREDIAESIRVITFCELADNHKGLAPIEDWSEVSPISENYDKSRGEIVLRINRLVNELKSAE